MMYVFYVVGGSLLVLIISMIIHIFILKRDQKDNEPDCVRYLKHPHKKCEGKNNMNEFILNDCASCPFWRGKC